MIETDVAILGAGPAGAAAALLLAPDHRVLLVDRQAAPAPRIGESLIPAARRLLRDMGILEAFEREGHGPYLGNRSIWGAGSVEEVDFLRGPDGPGWHLDRRHFEGFLRATARQRGARLLAPARLLRVAGAEGRWRLALDSAVGPRTVRARILIDAGGRSAPLAKRLGASRRQVDRLVACWLRGTVAREDGASAGFSLVESAPEGWWYSAPLPAEAGRAGRVLAFHSDADLVAARDPSPEALLDRARRLPGIGEMLSRVGFAPAGPVRRTAANTAVLEPVAGRGWLAIGDAALSLDPLSSCGLFNALYGAMSAASACRDGLEAGTGDLRAHAAKLGPVRAAYQRQLAFAYAAETRWPGSPFWARRRLAQAA